MIIIDILDNDTLLLGLAQILSDLLLQHRVLLHLGSLAGAGHSHYYIFALIILRDNLLCHFWHFIRHDRGLFFGEDHYSPSLLFHQSRWLRLINLHGFGIVLGSERHRHILKQDRNANCDQNSC